MHRIGTIVIVVFFWNLVAAQASNRVFIPRTPLTQQELDEIKASLIDEQGWSESRANEFVSGADTRHFRFTESDFRRAFSNLSPNDRQVSVCANSMIGGGVTRIVYLSAPSGNEVTVKSSTCRRVEGGMSCTPLSETVNYFVEVPEYNFTLGDGLSLAEAAELLAILREQGIADLPDWYQRSGFGYRDVTNIGKSGDVYTLRLGEHFCGGCTATFKVRIEATGNDRRRLTLVEEPDGLCI